MVESGSILLLVGEMKGKLEALTLSIQNLNHDWGVREESASQGRRIIHGKMDLLSNDVTRLGAEVENLSVDVKDIKPEVENFRNYKATRDGQAAGADKVRGRILALWSALSALVVAIGAAAVHFISEHWK